MAILINGFLTPSFSRTLSVAVSHDAAAGKWTAYTLTGSGESGQWNFLDGDVEVSVFGLNHGIANPPGFSPSGDSVDFRSYNLSATLLIPISHDPIDNGTTVRGIVWGWFQFDSLPGTTFAVLYVAQPGGGDRFIVALAEELSLIQKNPFFP